MSSVVCMCVVCNVQSGVREHRKCESNPTNH